jgi:hypothetical protein
MEDNNPVVVCPKCGQEVTTRKSALPGAWAINFHSDPASGERCQGTGKVVWLAARAKWTAGEDKA